MTQNNINSYLQLFLFASQNKYPVSITTHENNKEKKNKYKSVGEIITNKDGSFNVQLCNQENDGSSSYWGFRKDENLVSKDPIVEYYEV